ncbi:MAG TPA: hypothetical protein VJ867_07970 [Gemmatimonadaceae bacterium]|nr:hypothetical protein [Gemmatimonadaceae bacterium]
MLTSVGWLGAVAAFLALSAAGLTSRSPDTVRSAYVAMNLVGQLIIVPLSIAALLSGTVQALWTRWGLFRYYWVFTKFVLTVVATALLLLHQFTAVSEAATRAVGATPAALPRLDGLRTQLLVDAAAAIALLIATTVLSIYKPWGRTAWSQETPSTASHEQPSAPAGFRAFALVIAAIVATILIIHIAGGGLGHHH